MREHRPRTRDRCILEDESSLVRTGAEISARFRGENPDGSLCIFARCAQLGFSGMSSSHAVGSDGMTVAYIVL